MPEMRTSLCQKRSVFYSRREAYNEKKMRPKFDGTNKKKGKVTHSIPRRRAEKEERNQNKKSDKIIF